MSASAPLIVMPVIVIALLLPTVFEANVPLIPATDMETVSPLTTPESAADDVTSWSYASVVASYTRLLAVMPVTVNVFAVTDAEVDGWVRV